MVFYSPTALICKENIVFTTQNLKLSLCIHVPCSSRKYPYLSKGRLMEIPRGRGIRKAQFDAKLEFLEGLGSN